MVLTKENYKLYEKSNPFMAHNHIEICQADPSRSVVKVDLVPESRNLYGNVHGALLYAMADCVAGLAARADGGDYVTQSSHMNFLSNVSSGTIFARADVVKRGHRMAVFRIEVTDQGGKLLADGVVDLFKTSGAEKA